MATRMRLAIWLDDLRDPYISPWREYISQRVGDTHVYWATSYEEFIRIFPMLAADPDGEIVGVFFDNDLGEIAPGVNAPEGRHAFTWMEEFVHTTNMAEFEMFAQTDNPSARRELQGGFSALQRFWQRNAV